MDAVHAKGSFVFLQMWATGRASTPEHLAWEDPTLPYVSSSEVPLAGKDKAPRELSKEGIFASSTATPIYLDALKI